MQILGKVLSHRSRRVRGSASRPDLVEALEARILFTATQYLAMGDLYGGMVNVMNVDTHTSVGSFHPFGTAYKGGVSVALGDVDNDGTPEVIVSPTAVGSVPLVEVYSLSGTLERALYAFDPAFKGGVSVASGDFTGDSNADIVAAAGPGGGPAVRVFNGVTGTMVRNFFAFPTSFHGGVNIAVGDFNGDSTPDFFVAPKAGGGPVVRVFNGANGVQLAQRFVLADTTYTGGIRIAAGDVNNDGHADIITTPAAGSAAHITIFSYDGSTLGNFVPYTTTRGVTLATLDVDHDGNADIIVGQASNGLITAFQAGTHASLGVLNPAGDGLGFEIATFV